MDLFITFCRAVASLLITNSHYHDIYPISILACGGLMGDVIFFSVSGYCLYKLKITFIPWYLRRIKRIYPAIITVSIIFFIIGFYSDFTLLNIVKIFLYPTKYHFVSSIMILYIVYYFLIYFKFVKENLIFIMFGLFMGFLIYYILYYDKSSYRIDKVRLCEIRVLYFEAMLLGTWFKKNREQMMNNIHWWSYLLISFTPFLYITSKYFFSSGIIRSEYQIVNWISLFAFLLSFWLVMIGLEVKLRSLPKYFHSVVNFLAAITLEIYIVQYELIPRTSQLCDFPINFVITTSAIFSSAYIVHKLSNIQVRIVSKIFSVLMKKSKETPEYFSSK